MCGVSVSHLRHEHHLHLHLHLHLRQLPFGLKVVLLSVLPPRRLARLHQPGTLGTMDDAPHGALALMGPDERGWQRLWVGPKSASALNIHRGTIGNKVVEAVAQTEPMMLYVNPEAGGFDEWELPPGSGRRLMVGTPQRLDVN